MSVLSPGEQKLVAVRKDYLDNQANRICEQVGSEGKGSVQKDQVKREIVSGQPADEILRYIENNNIDLVTMATHGRSGIGSLTMGSVAYKVVRISKILVVLVRTVEDKPVVRGGSTTRTILVPLDGSRAGESVLQSVRVLVKQFGTDQTKVVLLSVCQPSSVQSGYPRIAISEGEASAGKQAFIHRMNAQKYLTKLEKQIKTSGIKVSAEVLAGDPAEKITGYASKIKANLIAMATHGRSGISRLAYGSVAENVIRGTSIPIFLVRP